MGPDMPQCCYETMEPSKVKFSPEVQTNMSEGSLISSSGIPDPVIRTVSDNRTDIMRLDRIKETNRFKCQFHRQVIRGCTVLTVNGTV